MTTATNTHARPRRPLSIATQTTRVANARFMAHVASWAMDTDTPIDIDSVALIIATAQHARPDTAFNCWTIEEFARFPAAIIDYCRSRDIDLPDDLYEQMALFMTFLGETGWLERPAEDATYISAGHRPYAQRHLAIV